MPTVSPETAAYGGFPTATVAGGTRNTLQTGIAGTVTTPVAGVTTTTRTQPAWRTSRLKVHRLNNTIATTATVVALNSNVDVATDAINVVRTTDRRPTTLITGKSTGRVRRLTAGAVATLSSLVGGAGYTINLTAVTTNMVRVGPNGDLLNQEGGCVCLVTTNGSGVVTACTLVATRGGTGYAVNTLLTAAPGTIGPGTGFSITVASVAEA